MEGHQHFPAILVPFFQCVSVRFHIRLHTFHEVSSHVTALHPSQGKCTIQPLYKGPSAVTFALNDTRQTNVATTHDSRTRGVP